MTAHRSATPKITAPKPDGDGLADRRPLLLGALLFAVVAGVFLPAVGHDFITYDDPAYVTQNAHVAAGLTWSGLRWAMQSTAASNWHPLTWLSHMADCQLYGLRPWGHHLTSVLLHALNAALLFAALRRMTGAPWRSLLVAALFGLHPLHVESVAWVAERKDVLSTTFALLALWAYVCRFERDGTPRRGSGCFWELALLFFALGLLCKPMLVTLPCVLLLLDFWPLHRWAAATAAGRWRLVLEKLPFFALAAASSAMTLVAQTGGGAVASTVDFPWPVRIANALIAYSWYLGRCFVPIRLAVFYPNFAEQPPLGATLFAAATLVAITAVAVALRRRRPYLLTGWLWFGGTLVPVIGLVQIGGQAMADRYSYVPLIGVFLAGVWLAGDAVASGLLRRRAAAWLAGALVAGLTALTTRQLAYWKDDVSLFRHALAVTQDNYVAHANLAFALAKTSPAQAAAEWQAMERIIAAFADRFLNQGVALERAGHPAEAIAAFRTAARILPVLPEAHYNLGTALAQVPGRTAEAVAELRIAARLRPDYAAAHFNLGTALAGLPGRQREAIAEFQRVVQLEPDNAGAHADLGALCANLPGRQGDAIAEYETAVRLAPDNYAARYNLAQLLADRPDRRAQALRQLEAALDAKPDFEPARELLRRLQASAR